MHLMLQIGACARDRIITSNAQWKLDLSRFFSGRFTANNSYWFYGICLNGDVLINPIHLDYTMKNGFGFCRR